MASRPIGSKATLKGKPVQWAGPDYGWQSPESFKKLEDEEYFAPGEGFSRGALRILQPVTNTLGNVFNTVYRTANEISPQSALGRGMMIGAAQATSAVPEALTKGADKIPGVGPSSALLLGMVGEQALERVLPVGKLIPNRGLSSVHTKLPEITRPLAKTGGKRASLGGTNPLDNLLTEVTGIQNRKSEWLTPTEKAKLAGDPDPYAGLDPKTARKFRGRDDKIQARMEQLTRPHLRNDQVGQLIRNAQSLKQKDPRLPRDFWSDSWWNLLGLKGERHHVAGLKWADSLFSNVTASTADKMREYALKRGVEFGDVFRNRADLPIDVHKKLHAWLTKNDLDGGNVKFKGDTFAERVEELDKLIEGVKASEEWINNWRRSNNIPIPTNNADLAIDKLHTQAASYIDAVDSIHTTKTFR